jgi:hypothetical protein
VFHSPSRTGSGGYSVRSAVCNEYRRGATANQVSIIEFYSQPSVHPPGSVLLGQAGAIGTLGENRIELSPGSA